MGTGEWRLAPAADGTAFGWSERVRLSLPLVGGLAAWCYRPILGALMTRALRDLRDEVARPAGLGGS